MIGANSSTTLFTIMKETTLMRFFGLLSTSVLSLAMSFLFGTTALIYAQDQPDQAKPSQQATRPGEAKPAEQSEDKPARGENKPAKQESGQTGQSNQHAQRSADHRGGRALPDGGRGAPMSTRQRRLLARGRV